MQTFLRKLNGIFARGSSDSPAFHQVQTEVSEEVFNTYSFVIGSLFTYFNELTAAGKRLAISGDANAFRAHARRQPQWRRCSITRPLPTLRRRVVADDWRCSLLHSTWVGFTCRHAPPIFPPQNERLQSDHDTPGPAHLAMQCRSRLCRRFF